MFESFQQVPRHFAPGRPIPCGACHLLPVCQVRTTRPCTIVKSNTSKEKFKSLVKKAKTYIEKGDIFQVVLNQRFERKINKTPIEIYNHLRKSNPSPFMFYFNYKDFNILGSSPEILVRLRGGEVTIRPIAGTRPRGKNSKEDKK